MEMLSIYLRDVVTAQTHDRFISIDDLLRRLGVDTHEFLLTSILSTVEEIETTEAIASLQSVLSDVTAAVLLAHKIDAYPETLSQIHDFLYTLVVYQDMDDTTIPLSIIEESEENNEAVFCELVAFANNSQAEDYLGAVSRVSPDALQNFVEAFLETDATENDDFDEVDPDEVRRSALPRVRQRVLAMEGMDDTQILQSVRAGHLKLALLPDIALAALDNLEGVDDKHLPKELIAIAMSSRLEDGEVNEWVNTTLTRFTDDPTVALKTQSLLKRLHLEVSNETA